MEKKENRKPIQIKPFIFERHPNAFEAKRVKIGVGAYIKRNENFPLCYPNNFNSTNLQCVLIQFSCTNFFIFPPTAHFEQQLENVSAIMTIGPILGKYLQDNYMKKTEN